MKRAQSVVEYSLFIFVLVAGLVGMQIYLKRSVGGYLRQNADQVGNQFDPANTTLYSSLNVTSNSTREVGTKLEYESNVTSSFYLGAWRFPGNFSVGTNQIVSRMTTTDILNNETTTKEQQEVVNGVK